MNASAQSLPGLRRREQLSDEVAGHLRTAIMSGTLRPGTFVRLDETAAALGVSITPVREALRTLRGEGMVQLEPNRGHVVSAFTRDDIDAALVRKVGRNVVMSLDEERIVAIHESGHALVGFLYTGAPLPRAIGIVPDGQTGAMGGVEYELGVRPNAQTREDLRARIAMALGGRAAEGVILGTVSVGAGQDLETANQLARAMVEQYAMAPKPSLLTFLRNTRESPGRTQEIEEQVSRILNEEYSKVAHLLSDHRALLLHLVEVLLRDKRIESADFERVLGVTPGQKVAIRNAANARNAASAANAPRNAPRG